jgi:hypothetical protein
VEVGVDGCDLLFFLAARSFILIIADRRSVLHPRSFEPRGELWLEIVSILTGLVSFWANILLKASFFEFEYP